MLTITGRYKFFVKDNEIKNILYICYPNKDFMYILQ